ncbi:hypothetical protein [Clostridium botulinum]|uniref:hypothetical protein n=1 Tax=Clostridium botulinum TaxID=1491 RepID=UPI0002D55E8C|nr:hypothetical protein [Clostridium botulinum]KEI02159.1 hypothetical protein Z953_07875 [Clostridium botulinum D str. 16868]KLU76441.1 hypothetical protein CBC3_03850 [Clostridium botulinum V891]KOA78828.1 hypothetical protein ADU78_00725 [Clostridium botulinum]KOA88875.1 hypothetical protein ADU76_14720 [Clostridium botulinum]KOC31098.1 hypothetical protein ADU81_14190 [Clostridium botulinum]
MLQNLSLKTGFTNFKNISKIETGNPIVLTGTTPSSKIIETIPITLNNSNSSVLLMGTVIFFISDSTANTNMGPLYLDILRPINGVNTVIYETGFKLDNVPFIASNPTPNIVNNFGFQWLDNPSSSLCDNSTINYTFEIATDGFADNTQAAGIGREDYYSLTVAEIPK